VRKYGLFVTFFVKERIWKRWEHVAGLVFALVAPDQQLRFVVFAGVFDPLHPSDVFVPHRLSSSIECPLEEEADPVKLSAVNRESTLGSVYGPVLALTLLATVEGR
jgi:hypothetical protein